MRNVEADPVIIVYYVDRDGLNSLRMSIFEARERKEDGHSERGPHLHNEINAVGVSIRKRLFGEKRAGRSSAGGCRGG